MNIYPNTHEVAQSLGALVAEAANEAVSARGQFCIALSGGSALEVLASALGADAFPSPEHGAAWRVFWVDERCVPFSSELSNAGTAVRTWLSKVPIPRDHLYPMQGEIDPDASARNYERMLSEVLRPDSGALPHFDLIVLGVGEDGHVASLFPGQPALEEQHRWVVPVADAPKPPPHRITLTLPVIRHARQIAVVAIGEGKREMVRRAFEPRPQPPLLPIQRVATGQVRWFIDQAAAADLEADVS